MKCTKKSLSHFQATMQAIVQTIRDVMQYNSLFAQQLGMTANPSKNVVDNPVYLCDLIGSLVSADAEDLQNLMEETNVNYDNS